VVGLVLWLTLLGFLYLGREPILFVLIAALAAATFCDAWISGIYKRPNVRSFLNISPMAWAIAMAGLFVVAYPAYLWKRNKLRTVVATNAYFVMVIVLGAAAFGRAMFNRLVVPIP
jgi:hypothetical protein